MVFLRFSWLRVGLRQEISHTTFSCTYELPHLCGFSLRDFYNLAITLALAGLLQLFFIDSHSAGPLFTRHIAKQEKQSQPQDSRLGQRPLRNKIHVHTFLIQQIAPLPRLPVAKEALPVCNMHDPPQSICYAGNNTFSNLCFDTLKIIFVYSTDQKYGLTFFRFLKLL